MTFSTALSASRAGLGSSTVGGLHGQGHAVDPPALHALDGERDVQRLGVVVLVVRGRIDLQVDDVAAHAETTELGVQQAGDRLVVLALGQGHPGLLEHLVGSQETRERPGAVGTVAAAARDAVVLVEHLADDLLDEVLEGDDAVGPAELVDDDRHLHPLLAQQGQQRVELEAVGHGGHGAGQVAETDAATSVGVDRDGLLHVHDADDVVRRPARDREP